MYVICLCIRVWHKLVSITNALAALGQWKYFGLRMAYITWMPGNLTYFSSLPSIRPSLPTRRGLALLLHRPTQSSQYVLLMLLTQGGKPASHGFPGSSILQNGAPKSKQYSLLQNLCSIIWNVSLPDRSSDRQGRVNGIKPPFAKWVKMGRNKGSKSYSEDKNFHPAVQAIRA